MFVQHFAFNYLDSKFYVNVILLHTGYRVYAHESYTRIYFTYVCMYATNRLFAFHVTLFADLFTA